ncbi:hypothetical protein GQ44DRAFT_697435 [Phaeosphaeriaceae sp. PMI808]|nr:hypothetical protein GQ44DRAFT_697435 [Phaeosphaeriaceae sp. PMI808]
MIGNAVSGIPITPLEFFTFGYVICALGMYFFWLHKPFDIQVPLTIHARSSRQSKSSTQNTPSTASPEEVEMPIQYIRPQRPNGFLPDNHYQGLWISQDQSMILSLISFTLLFSACHLFGWN